MVNEKRNRKKERKREESEDRKEIKDKRKKGRKQTKRKTGIIGGKIELLRAVSADSEEAGRARSGQL